MPMHGLPNHPLTMWMGVHEKLTAGHESQAYGVGAEAKFPWTAAPARSKRPRPCRRRRLAAALCGKP